MLLPCVDHRHFFYVLQDLRLPSVTTIAIPDGYDWREMLAYIMKHHQMEMTGGLGPSIGMVSQWCISSLYSEQMYAFNIEVMVIS